MTLPTEYRIDEALGIGEHGVMYTIGRKKGTMFIEVWSSTKLAEKRARRLLSIDAEQAAVYNIRDYGREFYNRKMI